MCMYIYYHSCVLSLIFDVKEHIQLYLHPMTVKLTVKYMKGVLWYH